jgi:cell wall-associated NlpC family hydrolase
MGQLIGRLAVVLLAAGLSACAARGGVPRPFPGAELPPGAGAPAVDDSIPTPAPPTTGVVAMALGYRGVPYRNGGSDPAGFDCSGFVQYVFRQAGTALPREVREQFRVGREVDRDDIEPGDLVFFETVSRGASHVGLAIGDGQFVHAPSSRGVVRVESLASSYWAPRYVGARRMQ